MRKQLSDFETDIQKCSKCGLCMSVCPVYKVTKNDCAVSRGKFIMLKGFINGDLKLNKNINKYLDMCLKCNACKDFCPTDIDAKKIFLCAKEEYFNSNKKLNNAFLNYYTLPIFNFSMKIIKLKTFLYRFLFLDKFVKLLYPLLAHNKCGRKVIFANKILERGFFNKKCKKAGKINKLKVIYFKGCVNEYINPRTKKAAEYLLTKMGVEILPVEFKCCGAPFLSEGDTKDFIKLAQENISKIPDDFDYFLTDCTTCKSTFKDYEDFIEDEKLLKKLKVINSKSVSINDFIVEHTESFELKKELSFTFHKPCHCDNLYFIEKFLKKCKNAKYVEMKDFATCCGFSGIFALKNREISEKISKQKAQNSIDTKADYILTTCPACTMGLNQGLIEIKEYDKFVGNFIEFIAENMTLQKDIITQNNALFL